jgi:hypothetical protein
VKKSAAKAGAAHPAAIQTIPTLARKADAPTSRPGGLTNKEVSASQSTHSPSDT